MGIKESESNAIGPMPDFSDWMSINEEKVEVMAGQHRIRALEEFVKQTGEEELWWPCQFYDQGMCLT